MADECHKSDIIFKVNLKIMRGLPVKLYCQFHSLRSPNRGLFEMKTVRVTTGILHYCQPRLQTLRWNWSTAGSQSTCMFLDKISQTLFSAVQYRGMISHPLANPLPTLTFVLAKPLHTQSVDSIHSNIHSSNRSRRIHPLASGCSSSNSDIAADLLNRLP